MTDLLRPPAARGRVGNRRALHARNRFPGHRGKLRLEASLGRSRQLAHRGVPGVPALDDLRGRAGQRLVLLRRKRAVGIGETAGCHEQQCHRSITAQHRIGPHATSLVIDCRLLVRGWLLSFQRSMQIADLLPRQGLPGGAASLAARWRGAQASRPPARSPTRPSTAWPTQVPPPCLKAGRTSSGRSHFSASSAESACSTLPPARAMSTAC